MMRYFEPDFFEDFHCIAERCRHSCCKGWEIDIDRESLIRYSKINGAIGQKLRNSISTEGEPCFILSEDESCPFLQDNGLCRLIIELGEDSLCEICREHPRFYNYYSGREERGLGLCCEEAVRLLLNRPEPFRIIEYEREGDVIQEDEIVLLRDRILEMLSDESKPLSQRMLSCLELCGAKVFDFDHVFWCRYLLSLERMDETWTTMLKKAVEGDSAFHQGIKARRLAAYFVYRHFAVLSSDYDPASALIFCFLSVAVIMAAGDIDGENPEHIRLYSCEIEYSDENVQLIMDKICKRQK